MHMKLSGFAHSFKKYQFTIEPSLTKQRIAPNFVLLLIHFP